MAEHRVDPTPGTTTDFYSRELPPILTVDPGDTVVVRSLDARGYLERVRVPGEERPRMYPEFRGHCLAGPIAVRGAEPGMMLGVRLADMRPDPWGWTAAGARDTPLNRRLGVRDRPPAYLLWDLDVEKGIGTDNHRRTVNLAPFLGVTGVAPAEPGEHSTIPPRPSCGGNIDCRALVAGTTLYLPVNVPEALLFLGDGHAAQGDGEVSGTAIECGMTTRTVLDLVTDAPISTVHAVTPTSRITFGFDEDLNEAMAQALDAMLRWMQSLYGVDKSEALVLASPVVDLRITQVVNEVWGVHAVLPDGAVS